VISIWTISAITLVANVFLVFGKDLPNIGPWLAETNVWFGQYFEKDRMPIPRLILFGFWFLALLFLSQRFERWITKWLGWILLPFGTNSLYIYTIQAFVVFFVLLLMPIASDNWIINLAVSLLTLGVVYLAVRTKFLMRVIPR